MYTEISYWIPALETVISRLAQAWETNAKSKWVIHLLTYFSSPYGWQIFKISLKTQLGMNTNEYRYKWAFADPDEMK